MPQPTTIYHVTANQPGSRLMTVELSIATAAQMPKLLEA